MIFFLVADTLCKFEFDNNIYLAKTGLYAVNAFIYNNLRKDLSYDPNTDLPKPLFSIIPVLPVSLLSIAAILNLNNWTFYYFKIGEMASHIDTRALKHGDFESIRRKRWAINLVTFIAIFSIVGFVSAISYKTIDQCTE